MLINVSFFKSIFKKPTPEDPNQTLLPLTQSQLPSEQFTPAQMVNQLTFQKMLLKKFLITLHVINF